MNHTRTDDPLAVSCPSFVRISLIPPGPKLSICKLTACSAPGFNLFLNKRLNIKMTRNQSTLDEKTSHPPGQTHKVPVTPTKNGAGSAVRASSGQR
jgi:hypothetical protein